MKHNLQPFLLKKKKPPTLGREKGINVAERAKQNVCCLECAFFVVLFIAFHNSGNN